MPVFTFCGPAGWLSSSQAQSIFTTLITAVPLYSSQGPSWWHYLYSESSSITLVQSSPARQRSCAGHWLPEQHFYIASPWDSVVTEPAVAGGHHTQTRFPPPAEVLHPQRSAQGGSGSRGLAYANQAQGNRCMNYMQMGWLLTDSRSCFSHIPAVILDKSLNFSQLQFLTK